MANSTNELEQFSGDYIGYPLYTQKRVGNPAGTFGVSQVHGQLPGETIYYVVPVGTEEKQKTTVIAEIKRINTMKGVATTVSEEFTIKDLIADTLDKDKIPIRDSFKAAELQEEFNTAIENRDAAKVARLLPNVDPAANNNHAIRSSSEKGYADVVKLLLEDQRANPAVQFSYAIWSSSENGHADVVKLLLADGRANPEANYDAAIRVSSAMGHTDVVKLLLADPRVNPRANRNIAIKMAKKNGYPDVVELLQEHGATLE